MSLVPAPCSMAQTSDCGRAQGWLPCTKSQFRTGAVSRHVWVRRRREEGRQEGAGSAAPWCHLTGSLRGGRGWRGHTHAAAGLSWGWVWQGLGKEIKQADVGHLHPPKFVHVAVAGRKTHSERNSIVGVSPALLPLIPNCTSSQATGRDHCKMENWAPLPVVWGISEMFLKQE